MMKFKLSDLAHRSDLNELKILYRQLLLLSHQNQKLNKRKLPVNDQLLAKNKKLQIVIREKMKSVDKFIGTMNSIIEKKIETKKNEKKNVMESPYIKVNTDTTHWLRRPTVTPSTSRDSEASSSLKLNQVAKESKDAQTNTTNEAVEQFKSRLAAFHNVIHYDSEIHWCKVCNVFPKTAKDYLNHLHTTKHKSVVSEQNLIELPWQKNEPDKVEADDKEAPVKRIPIRGLQFLVAASAWYCKLCSEWIGDLVCASNHLKSCLHAQKYSEFIEQNPHWEVDWLIERTQAYEQFLGNRYESDKRKITQINKTSAGCCSLINLSNLKEEKEDYIHSQTPTSGSSCECACSTCSETSQAPSEMIEQAERRISRLIEQEIHRRGDEIYYERKNQDNQNKKRKEINYSKRSELYNRRSERGNKIQDAIYLRSERYDRLRSERSYDVRSVMDAKRRNELYERIEINERTKRKKSPPIEKSPIKKRKRPNRKKRQKESKREKERKDKGRREISSGIDRPELSKTRNKVSNQLTNVLVTTTNKQNTLNDQGKNQICMKEKLKPINSIKNVSCNVQCKSDGECSSTITEEETEVELPSILPIVENKTCYQISNKKDSQAVANSGYIGRNIVEFKLQKTLLDNLQVKPLSSMALNRIESVRSDPGSIKIMDNIMNRQRPEKFKNMGTNFESKLP